jgi:hypothetical protein
VEKRILELQVGNVRVSTASSKMSEDQPIQTIVGLETLEQRMKEAQGEKIEKRMEPIELSEELTREKQMKELNTLIAKKFE